MKKKLTYLIALLTLTIYSCSTSKELSQATNNEEITVEEIVLEKDTNQAIITEDIAIKVDTAAIIPVEPAPYAKITDKKEFVEYFLSEMKKTSFENAGLLKDFISPSYLKEVNVPEGWKVDSYHPDDYLVKSVDETTGIVVANIWFNDTYWKQHQLTFKVVSEEGRLYLWGNQTGSDKKYVDPWIEAKLWLERKTK